MGAQNCPSTTHTKIMVSTPLNRAMTPKVSQVTQTMVLYHHTKFQFNSKCIGDERAKDVPTYKSFGQFWTPLYTC